MKKNFNVVTLLFFFMANSIYAGEWIGPNLVANGTLTNQMGGGGWYINAFPSWSNSSGAWNTDGLDEFHYRYEPWDSPAHCELANSYLNQAISVQNGKRYRLSGEGCVCNPAATLILSANGITSMNWTTYANPLTKKSIDGISSVSSAMISIYATKTNSFSTKAYVDNIGLSQVIYDPQINIGESSLNITRDLLNSAYATVQLTLNDLSFADTPTSWGIIWGDGSIEINPALNTIHEHNYLITQGIGQQWFPTLYGVNEAGSVSDSAVITLVPEPTSLALLALGGLLIRRRKK